MKRFVLSTALLGCSTFAFGATTDLSEQDLTVFVPSITTEAELQAKPLESKIDPQTYLSLKDTKRANGQYYIQYSEATDELNDPLDSAYHFDNHNEHILSETPLNASMADLLAVNPVPTARVSSHYGPRNMGARHYHYGIDLAAPTGTPIYSAGDGIVIFAGPMSGYGRMIEIDHGNGYKTRYGHPSKMHVSVGDRVSKKQHIADVGCAGRCTGPHLHYEVRQNGKPVNPAPYIALADKAQ